MKELNELKRFPDGVVAHDPKNKIHINEIWAVLSVDPADNTEGICSVQGPIGQMPLLAADKARLDSILSVARDLKRYTDKRIILVRFSKREDVEVL